MPDFHHGVRVVELTTGARPLATIATAVIGVVCTAPDADPVAFPSDVPVLVTNPAAALADAGIAGTLAPTLRAIADQANAIVIVVRVEEGEEGEGEEPDTTTPANVIGTHVDGVRTGMQALLGAEAALGVRPRILATPGLETQAVTTALAVVAQKLRAMAYAAIPDCATVADAITYRELFSSRELCLIWGDFEAYDPVAATTVTVPSAALAVGLRAKIDNDQGWHKTLSNVPVNGVTGLTLKVSWALQDPNTDVGLLNAAGVTALIQSTGFRFWGNRTCSEAVEFQFETATRTAQVLMDTIGEGMMWAIDKPLTPGLSRDIIETIRSKFRSLKAQGYILGGDAWLDASRNTADVLALGQLVIDYDYTPVPPLEQLFLQQRITDRYLADFASLVATA